MPLGNCNSKRNQPSNYSTYDQELLAGMLVLSSESRLLGSNTIVSLCDQERLKFFQKGPPPGKAKPKRRWTSLSQFGLTVHHISATKNELSDYISRTKFDALIGVRSEAHVKEAFQHMDIQLDLSMRTAAILQGSSLTDYQLEHKNILPTFSTGLEPCVIDKQQWYKNDQYLFYEDRIVVPEAESTGVYSGPISAQVTLALIAQCTSSASVSTPVYH